MKYSVVIPAFNEAGLLGACVDGARAAFAARGETAEIVVCDNNSTDGTAAVAAGRGARVVFQPANQISLARNTGAAAAGGDWLVFIDADSRLSPETLGEALALMRGGRCCGGSALIAFDPPPPWWGSLLTGGWNLLSRIFSLGAGSFMFCRADAFRGCGGFSAELYAGEEVALTRALKAWGRPRGLGFTVITCAPHVSSGRKFRLYTFGELALGALRCVPHPFRSLRDPSKLNVFYEGRRKSKENE